ncbi:DUF4126 family protein [Rhizobium sp. S152]|uniref:DUF4126 family protein n=1 Tax=Rhizobium sp. S152 TaxID=3055038 RepID=UPI0025AA176F|nr:DUF4126 family protein [Rhizobium sp. S152]MDM9627829.1 DUF4126 family protein [Rhizobium sp. S152]
MTILIFSLCLGITCGLRAMTPPAAVAWAAHIGWLDLSDTWLAFVGSMWTLALLTLLAMTELVTDQLPSTPSRKVPQQFGARLFTGGFVGAALALPHVPWIVGAAVGAIGAVIGTYGGAALRAKLASAFGKDLPAALLEDAVAVCTAGLIVAALP